MINKKEIELLKEKKEAEKELNKIIRKFCKDNNIKKVNKTYSFTLGDTMYRVSNHKVDLTGNNNFTIYDTYKDSGKKQVKMIFIYDNDNNIIEIYKNLKKEYLSKLKVVLDDQTK